MTPRFATRRSGMTEWLGQTVAFPALAFLTAYLIFIGGGWTGIYWLGLRVLSLVLATALLATWFVVAWGDPSWRPRSRIMPALLLGLAAMAVAMVYSRQPRLAFDYLAYAVLLVAFYLFLVRVLAHPFFSTRFLDLVTMLAGTIGVSYLVQVVVTWIEWWSLVEGGLAAPPLRPAFAGLEYGNPSAVMTISILLTLPAVGHLGFGSRRRAAASTAIGLLALFCTIASGSRAGWLAVALTGVVAVTAWLLSRGHRGTVRRALERPQARLAAAGVSVAALVVAALFLPGALARFGAGGEALRLGFFQAALRMFIESPVVGTGPGTYAAYRAAQTSQPADDYYVPHAHSLYLQTAAELGIVGIIVGIVGVAMIGRLILGAIRSTDNRRSAMGWAAALALFYFGAHQFLDLYASMPAALAAAAIPIACLDAKGAQRAEAAAKLTGLRSWDRLLAPLGAILIVGSVSWLSLSEARAAIHQDAVALTIRSEWPAALERAREAASADPNIPAYQFTLGLAAMNAGRLDEAVAAYGIAANADDFPESWLGLAMAQIETGDTAGARASLERAMRLGRRHPTISIATGQLYAKMGDQASAKSAYVEALVLAPSLFGDPDLGALVQPLTVDELAAASASRLAGSSGAVQLALERDRRADAESAAQALGPSERALFDLVVPAWFGDASAGDQLAALARRQPQNLTNLDWAGLVAAHVGAAKEAMRYRRIADIDLYPFSAIGTETRLAPPGDPRAGGDISIYGTFLYRRPTPPNMLPAALWGLRNE